MCVDTEFLREKTLYPRLCLLQMSVSADDIACVDPFADFDLSGVARLMTDERVTKVIHACSQDLEAIDHALGVIPGPVFDTQVAAAFLGHRMQLGYAALVESLCDVRLPKAESLTDWAQRPLDAEQLAYAEDDVRYLPQIYHEMQADLIRRDRLAWVRPEMEALNDPARVRLSPEEAYTHLRRVTSLTRRQMGMAREVCAWRERLAAARDIPRKWVLSDEVVLEVCKRIPRTRERLARIRGAERLSATDANALLEAVYAGLVCPEEELPRYVRRQRPAAEVESVLDLMYAMLRVISDRSGVATQLIATRDDLQDLVSGKSGRLSEGWRAELAGKPLTRLLEGEVGLTVKNGRIELL